MTAGLGIASDRVNADLAKLATFTSSGRGITRRAFGAEHGAGRAWLSARMRDAGLTVRVDAGGNLVGRSPGTGPVLATGSHSDTVWNGGAYDGMLGVVAGIEVARVLQDTGWLRHPLEVIDFLAEEPTDFGVSCVGSRALAGVLTEAQLALAAPDGETLAAALRRVGGDPEALGAPLRDDIAGFVELHVEQGPLLEQRGQRLAAVTTIAGISRWRVEVTGRQDHPGTTPMDVRRDALVAAAEVITAFAGAAASRGDRLVGTIGRIDVEPNAVNVIPGRVQLIAELRSPDAGVVDDAFGRFRGAAAATARTREVGVDVTPLTVQPPRPMHPSVREAAAGAITELGEPVVELPSGAGHDAAHVATLAPTGMLFVPSRDGRSHCPEEHTDPADVALGAEALLRTLRRLDRMLPEAEPQ